MAVFVPNKHTPFIHHSQLLLNLRCPLHNWHASRQKLGNEARKNTFNSLSLLTFKKSNRCSVDKPILSRAAHSGYSIRCSIANCQSVHFLRPFKAVTRARCSSLYTKLYLGTDIRAGCTGHTLRKSLMTWHIDIGSHRIQD